QPAFLVFVVHFVPRRREDGWMNTPYCSNPPQRRLPGRFRRPLWLPGAGLLPDNAFHLSPGLPSSLPEVTTPAPSTGLSPVRRAGPAARRGAGGPLPPRPALGAALRPCLPLPPGRLDRPAHRGRALRPRGAARPAPRPRDRRPPPLLLARAQ